MATCRRGASGSWSATARARKSSGAPFRGRRSSRRSASAWSAPGRPARCRSRLSCRRTGAASRPSSRPVAEAPIPRQRLRLLLVGSCCILAAPLPAYAAEQQGAAPQTQERRIVIDGKSLTPDGTSRLNTTGKTVTLTVPAKDGPRYLGDIILTVSAEDRVEFSANRLLDLLANVLDPDVLRTLRGSFSGETALTPADFEASGIHIRYNPQTLELQLDIASERRASRTVQVSPLDRDRIGEFVQPAGFSAYLNLHGSLDYIHQGSDDGLQAPSFFMDGATRFGGIVLESEAAWSPGTDNHPDFQRIGTRAVYDDQH